MKRISKVLLAIFVFVCGVFISACGNEEKPEIKFSESNVVMYLGENDNTYVISATLVGVKVDKLSLAYDNTNFTISQNKVKDNAFDLTITAKGEMGCKDVEVTVNAGAKASNSFKVSIIVPVSDILIEENQFVAFNGSEVIHNLYNNLTFVPTSTKQRNVSFQIYDETSQSYVDEIENYAKISGEYLVVSENFENFENDIRVVVQSEAEGKSSLRKEFTVKVIPNAVYYANEISMTMDLGAGEVEITDNVKLSINNNVLDPFVINAYVPMSIGIGVDVDLSNGINNVMQYLNVKKRSYEIDLDGDGNNDTYKIEFTFTTLNLKSANALLYFKAYYLDEQFKNIDILTGDFAIVGEEVKPYLPITIEVPVESLSIIENGLFSDNRNFVVYDGYTHDMVGTQIVVSTKPANATLQTLKVESLTNVTVKLWDKDTLSYFDLSEGDTYKNGSVLYIKGVVGHENGALTISCGEGDSKKEITLNFDIKKGATALGFAEKEDPSLEISEYKDVAVECGNIDGSKVLLFAPNTTLADLIFDPALSLVQKTGGYYEITVISNTVGKKSYEISTNNGYAVVLNVETIQTLTHSNIVLGNNSESDSGVGRMDTIGTVPFVSLKYGYSLSLGINVNENAEIYRTKYLFFDAVLGDLLYETVYSDAYMNFGIDAISPQSLSSKVIDASMLQNERLITALNEGKVYVEVIIEGYKVKDGVVVPSSEVLFELPDGSLGYEICLNHFIVEVYRPAKDITASTKTIEVRSENQLDEANFDEATKTIDLGVITNGTDEYDASYNKILIDRGAFDPTGLYILYTQGSESSSLYYTAKLYLETNKLEINVKKIPDNYSSSMTQTITLFVADFYLDNTCALATVKQNYTVITYEINIKIILTNRVEDVSITSLKLESDETDGGVRIKTYESLYFDTFSLESGSTKAYKILTEVTPINAFNKELVYTFAPDINVSSGLIDVSKNDGTVYYSTSKGGTGKIYIRPADPKASNIVLIIPVVVADGNSSKTAFVISDLTQIVNPTKHYRLKTSVTLEIGTSLFVGESFIGGLYGEFANIKLNGCTLFDSIGMGGVVENLTLYGDALGSGFVANENSGTINNVKVVSFVGNKGYIPSVLTAPNGTTAVGGLVGTNFANGKIINSSFAGTIKAYETTPNIFGLIGENKAEVSTSLINCNVVVAKYEYLEQSKNRLISVTEGLETIYKNGIILLDSAGNVSLTREFNNNLKEPSYLLENEYIRSLVGHSIGKEDSKYGVVYYYGAKNSNEQELLSDEGYNQIPISTYSYVNENGETVTVEGLIATQCSMVRVVAQNTDGTRCGIASVSGNYLNISGTGLFNLVIYSEFDYTKSVTINMLAINFMSEFELYLNEDKLVSGDEINLLKGYRKQIQSKINASVVVVGGKTIEIKQNDFTVMFGFNDGKASDFITGTGVGIHTINALWDGEKELSVLLETNLGGQFNSLINGVFCNEYKLTLNSVNGTTKIETSASESVIEPKDGIVINAIITTDNVSGGLTGDYIDPETITITDEFGNKYIDATLTYNDIFNIYVGGAIKTDNSNQFKFEITITLKDEYKHKNTYVNKLYLIKIQATNDEMSDNFEAVAIFNLTIVPQSLSNIKTTVYNFTSYNGDDAYVQKEPPVSVIKPIDTALLVVDLYPTFASFDYIEVSSTSNTLASLAFRVREREGNTYKPNTTSKIEALANTNGVRIYNNFESKNINQFIGSYYLEIWSTNTLDQDAIFTINVSAFFDGEKLDKTSTFSLYVNAPTRPSISIDGKTSIYAYPGEEFSADLQVYEGQDILSTVTLKDDVGQNIDGFVYDLEKVIQETVTDFETYKLTFTVPTTVASKHLILTVYTEKVENGSHIQIKNSIHIFMVDFKAPEDSIGILGEVENRFTVSSIKYNNLSLYTNLSASYDDEEGNEAVNLFNSNYYYLNELTGFEFGKNYGNSAYNLAAHLYYANGDTLTPIAIFNDKGEFLRFTISDYNRYIKFNILETVGEDNKTYYNLQVKGMDQAGEIPMMLRMYYQVPGNVETTTFTYEHRFTIVNSIYTSEDKPIEVASAENFMKMFDSDTEYDYILNSDIYLYEYEPASDTAKIKSLDGNNYTIYIMSFAENNSTSLSYSLFQSVSANTTIKNLTVSYYYLSEIVIAEEVNDVTFAGLTISNNGIIYNSEVMVYAGAEKTPTHTAYGIKILTSEASNVTVNVAGFALENRNSITHSRVGGTEKLITSFDYLDDENVKLNSKTVKNEIFTIRASGTISGFCYTNSGVIASSYAKNIQITNTYNKNSTVVTSGFVNSNEGTITMSYVEGVKNSSEIQARNGGIEATGILAGFVYSNVSKISDCYSNIMLHSPSNQVGRLGAGFVFYNGPEGSINACYSFSSVSGNNTTQLNFSGITELMQYNNFGIIENCYYYATDDMKLESLEDLFYTNIQVVEEVGDPLNFYGFSFASKTDASLTSTWKISTVGPQLVSADDLAYSVRYKTENPDKEDSLDYLFVYDNNYDLGTINNPIIIRNAVELNGSLGGYYNTNTEIEENFNVGSKKIFGAYRLVNNIDLNELIIEGEEDDADYKYNLASTSYTLTGEAKNISKRNGSFNGNGLVIENLAISNEKTTGSENYGLFKSIENSASVSNVNITLAKGGVKADNTTNVGTIAGTLSDSAITNITISANNEEDHTDVIGANIVGGAVGRVIKDSYVYGVSVNNISVIATHNHIESANNTLSLTNNMYIRTSTSYKNTSIAGGVFGVVDTYNKLQEDGGIIEIEDINFADVQSLKVEGAMTISAMTVGGVVGFVGQNTIAKDMSLEISKSLTKQAKLISYSLFAGGIVGFNLGYLYQIKAEHEKAWQTQIETTMDEYYLEEDENERALIDRGNIDLFTTAENEITYYPTVIGGLVGVMANGTVEVAYSKIHVKNNHARYAGGAIGFINSEPGIIVKENVNANSKIELSEVYTTGDVYAGGNGKVSYTGGVVAYNAKSDATFTKINALNYWGDTIKNKDANHIFTQLVFGTNEATIANSLANTGVLKEVKINNNTYSIDRVNAEDNENDYKFVSSYYGYKGISEDSGAKVDVPFVQNDWYISNWERDNTELYPHIRYINPSSIYEIYDKDDFNLFAKYGSDPNAVFIVTNPGLIPCAGAKRTYPVLKGTLVGLYPESGFANLSVSLFRKVTGKITSLNFDSCSSAIAITAENNAIFSNLSYKNCIFSIGYFENGIKYVSGIVHKINPQNVLFENIKMDTCRIDSTSSTTVLHAGGLFAFATGKNETSANPTITPSERVTIKNVSLIEYSQSITMREGGYVGALFGSANNVETSEVTVDQKAGSQNAIKVYAEIPEEEAVALEPENSENNNNTHIGYVGGNVNYYGSFADTYVDSADLNVKLQAGMNDTYIGGFVGRADGLLEIKLSEEETTKSPIFNANIMVDEISNNSDTSITTLNSVYMGGIAGYVNNLKFELYKNVVVGSKASLISVKNSDKIASLFVGGVAGSIKKLDSSINHYLKFDGDILIEDDGINETSTGVYYSVGGFAGFVDGETNINRIIISGSITLDKNIGATFYLGGLIGRVSKNITISQVYTLGDIVLSGKELKVEKSSFAGGLVGQLDKAKVDEDKVTVTFSGNNYSLTTIFYNKDQIEVEKDAEGNITSKEQLINVDAVLNNTNGTVEMKATTEDGVVKYNTVWYASNVNLAVSDYCATFIKDGTEKISTNKEYKTIKEELSTDRLAEDVALIEALGLNGEAGIGTKLNPVMFSDALNEVSGENSEYIIKDVVKFTNDITITGGGDTESLRKVYVYFDNLEETLNKQITLNNAIMFSDGASIYTTVTPFKNISKTSAVAGVIVKAELGDKPINKAGFANTNHGIIYTCMVQEALDYFTNNDSGKTIETKYTATLETANNEKVSGFIYQNYGYIFGSNSNIQIFVKKANTTVAGFAILNQGVIEHSYANGYVEGNKGIVLKQLELFAINDKDANGNVLGKVENCYTIFANRILASTNIVTLSDGCEYDADACETEVYNRTEKVEAGGKVSYKYVLVDGTKLYGINETPSNYFATEEMYNNNFPTISGEQFVNISYTKRLTQLNRIMVESKYGLEGDVYYYCTDIKPEGVESDNIKENINIVPNITVFKELVQIGEGKYLLSRSLNMGYTIINTDKQIEVKKSYDTTIISAGGNINDNKFELMGNGFSIDNLILDGANLIGTLGKEGTIDGIIFNNVTLKNSTGLIGENKGNVQSIKIQGSIKIDYSVDTTAGVLVGKNTGTVTTCVLEGNLSTEAYDEDKTYAKNIDIVLGGLVGENQNTVTQSTLRNGNLSIILPVEMNITFGGIVGKQTSGETSTGETSTGETSTSGLDGYNITIITGTNDGASTLIVGGIVGELDDGTVKTCYTDSKSTIKVGSDEYKIMDNTEYFATKCSYAGGIVGFASETTDADGNYAGTIEDCQNGAKVTADAQWNKVLNADNEYKAGDKYIYVDKGETALIYIYSYMESKAYAGGISGNGVSTDSNNLANDGVVSGGFKVWKPLYAISTSADDFNNLLAKRRWGSAGVWGGLTGVAGMAIGGFLASNPVGWIIGAVGFIGLEIWGSIQCKKARDEAEKAYIYAVPFEGNSSRTNEFGDRLCVSIEDLKYHLSEKIDDEELQKFQKNNLSEKITELTVKEVKPPMEYDTSVNYDKNEDLFNKDKNEENLKASKSSTVIYYDVISPNLKGTETAKNFYSSTVNYSLYESDDGSTGKIFNTANKYNKDYIPLLNNGYLVESGTSCKHGGINGGTFKERCPECYEKSLGDVGDDGNWSDAWTDNGKLIASFPDKINVNNGVITLKDANLWRNLAHTVNSWFEDSTTKDTPLTINIELSGDQQYINVGYDTIKQFKGTINVLDNEQGNKVYFTNIKHSVSRVSAEQVYNTKQYGLIEKVIGDTEINNLQFEGNIEITENTQGFVNSISYISLGGIIGKVAEGTATLNKTIFEVKNIIIDSQIMHKVNSVGGFVAENAGTLTIESSLINIQRFIAIADVLEKNSSNYNSFGGYIAKNSGTATISNSSSIIKATEMISEINVAGGLVGENIGTLNIPFADSNIKTLAITSTGNTCVGGAIGKNSGEIDVTYLDICNAIHGALISADVIFSDTNAYVGGIIGYNNSSNVTLNKITVGNDSGKGYSSIHYILAGYNNGENSQTKVIPAYAYASKTIGYDDNSTVITTYKTHNTIARAIYKTTEPETTELSVTSNNNINESTYKFDINGSKISATSEYGAYYVTEGGGIARYGMNEVTNSTDYAITSAKQYTLQGTIGKTEYYEIEIQFTSKYEEKMYNKDGELITSSTTNIHTYKFIISRHNTKVTDGVSYNLSLILVNTNINGVQTEYNSTLYSTEFTSAGSITVDGYSPNMSFQNLVSFEYTDDGNYDNNSVGFSDDPFAELLSAPSKNETITYTQYMLSSKDFAFAINDGIFTMKENISVESQTTTFIYSTTTFEGETVDPYWDYTDVEVKEEPTLIRTLFSFTVNNAKETYTGAYVSVKDGEGNAAVDKYNYEFTNKKGVTTTGIIDKETVVDKYIIPAVGTSIDLSVYDYTINGKNVKIISHVKFNEKTGLLDVEEHIIEKNTEGTYSYRGKLTYSMDRADMTGDWLSKRYESYLPVSAGSSAINIVYDLKTNEEMEEMSDNDIVINDIVRQYYEIDLTDSTSVSFTSISYKLTVEMTDTDSDGYEEPVVKLEKLTKDEEETTEKTLVEQTASNILTIFSGDYSGIGCDEYYTYNGQIVGYRKEATIDDKGANVYYYYGGTEAGSDTEDEVNNGTALGINNLKLYKVVDSAS